MAAELKVFTTSLLQKIESRSNPEMGPYHVSDFDRQRVTISSAEYARLRAINGSGVGILSLFKNQNRLMQTYDLDDNWRHQLLPLYEPTSGLQQSRLTNCGTLLFDYHVHG